MIEDPAFALKMLGIWQMSEVPNLKARFENDQVVFSWGNDRLIASLSRQLIEQLEPIEILELLERHLSVEGAPVRKWRNDFRHFTKNPLE
jgi:hypothetical protein|tara:strand:+ start:265 stop:534 length:270 start_codon:yes stop_codon:yes gene_type:complete